LPKPSFFGEAVRAFCFLVFADGVGAPCADATVALPIKTIIANAESADKIGKLSVAIVGVNDFKCILAVNT
jgi:hypothetical protein